MTELRLMLLRKRETDGSIQKKAPEVSGAFLAQL